MPTPMSPMSIEDRAVLVALYNATNGAGWKNNANWLSDAPIRHWFGVTTGPNERVTALELWGNQLIGEIPPELGSLTSLTWLNLSGNQLSGEMPPQLGSLVNLTGLSLRNNLLTGEIPPELGITHLTTLRLDGNRLTGEIPGRLARLNHLVKLDLGGNQLTGAIPPELGELSSLKELSLRDNDLNRRDTAGVGRTRFHVDRAGATGKPLDRKRPPLARKPHQPRQAGLGGKSADRRYTDGVGRPSQPAGPVPRRQPVDRVHT